jgi:hypothetical protein
LQAVQLATVQDRWDEVPQAGTCGLFCFTESSSHHPGIYRVTLKRLLALALRLREGVLLPQLFRPPALVQMEPHAHLTQEAVQVLLAHLDRAEGRIPLAPLA